MQPLLICICCAFLCLIYQEKMIEYGTLCVMNFSVSSLLFKDVLDDRIVSWAFEWLLLLLLQSLLLTDVQKVLMQTVLRLQCLSRLLSKLPLVLFWEKKKIKCNATFKCFLSQKPCMKCNMTCLTCWELKVYGCNTMCCLSSHALDCFYLCDIVQYSYLELCRGYIKLFQKFSLEMLLTFLHS